MSLRDVERAMIVLKYFYEKMDVIAPLVEKKQQEEGFYDSDDEYSTASSEDEEMV